MARKPNGWQLRNMVGAGRVAGGPLQDSTRWGQMLLESGIEREEQARQAFQQEPHRQAILEFARANVDRCYLPTWLLEELRLRTRFDY